MNAKDTVMSMKKLRRVYNGVELKPVLEAQADISFKAGMRKVVETTVYLALANGKVSIRELFELHPEGKAKLKEWGL